MSDVKKIFFLLGAACLSLVPAWATDAPAAEVSGSRFNISLGANVGTTFFSPNLDFQIALFPSLALGLGGNFVTSYTKPVSLVGVGGFATLNYYSQEFFRGFWVKAGAGAVFFSTTGGASAESARSLQGIATIGYRGSCETVLNFGVGAGVQYTADPQFPDISAITAGFRPVVALDLGLDF